MNTWPTLNDPRTPALPVSVQTRSETGRNIDTSGALGRGLVRPFRRDQKNDFANESGVAVIASNIGQILGTICGSDASGGELPWRTEFGSLLHILRLRNNTETLVDQARAYVALAIERWEPRARLTSVRVSRVVEEGKLIITIGWTPRSQGSERVVVAGLETQIAIG